MPIFNPNDLGGYGDAEQQIPRIVFPYKASAAVSDGQVVAIGTDGRVAVAATDGTASLCVGIADENIAAGETGNVAVWGYKEGVVADGTIGAGALLKRSATTAGAVAATATPAAGEVIGVAVAASAGGTVKVLLKAAAGTGA